MRGHPPVRTAVIPAAGLATRMLPATTAVPKVMLPVVDKPVIQYVVEEVIASGIRRIVVVTPENGTAIRDHFGPHPALEARLAESGREAELAELRRLSEQAEFIFVPQLEPKGNGHAVLCAREVVGDDEPFLMVFGDDLVASDVPCARQLIQVYERHGGAVAAVMRVQPDEVSRYGVIDGQPIDDRVHRVNRVVEKPSLQEAPSRLAAVHAWLLTPPILALLAETPPGAGGEIWLVDAIQRLIAQRAVFALEFDGRRYDVGHKLGFLQATVDFALRRPDLGPEFAAYLESLDLPGGWTAQTR